MDDFDGEGIHEGEPILYYGRRSAETSFILIGEGELPEIAVKKNGRFKTSPKGTRKHGELEDYAFYSQEMPY